jgi:hypothetical protein
MKLLQVQTGKVSIQFYWSFINRVYNTLIVLV